MTPGGGRAALVMAQSVYPYVQDTARRASRPRAKSQPYKSIEQCVREAKALGISYGQFVARGLDRM